MEWKPSGKVGSGGAEFNCRQIFWFSVLAIKKLPLTSWLKATHIYYLTVLKTEFKIGSQGCIPVEALGRICFLAFSSFQRLPAFLGSWLLPSSSKHVTPTSVSVVSSPSSDLDPFFTDKLRARKRAQDQNVSIIKQGQEPWCSVFCFAFCTIVFSARC